MMRYIIVICMVVGTHLFANEAQMIMQKIDKNMRGNSSYIKMTMRITSLRHTRTMKMEVYSKGKDKSFVKTLYPPKDRGITFLSLKNQMWQYIPKIERVIKIPPSMMLQNWMGSDITNDDMVKQSSIVDDYDAKILKKEGKIVTIELTPKEDSAVVWGKIISRIDTKTFTSLKDIFYDEEGEEVRVFIYKKVKKFGAYYTPTVWEIRPSDKKGAFTQVILNEVEFDKKISPIYFTKRALKRFSR